ncbi:hypothetical protein [Paraburkholderia mimosarum]|uniref:hypothetical protein n=1 Tax=Paraburkholderia mimosarum TaxID=312026 RepID=UPI0012B614EC|nr:hypothetical protein [Paraburkholderia mimosarum]
MTTTNPGVLKAPLRWQPISNWSARLPNPSLNANRPGAPKRASDPLPFALNSDAITVIPFPDR